jgi:hypothetical protein
MMMGRVRRLVLAVTRMSFGMCGISKRNDTAREMGSVLYHFSQVQTERYPRTRDGIGSFFFIQTLTLAHSMALGAG